MNKRQQALVKIVTNPQSAQPLTLRIVIKGGYATRGQASDGALVASGGTGGYVYDIDTGSSLPGGLTLDTVTGEISGTPTTIGHFTFVATVQDSSSTLAKASFSIDVVSRLVATFATPAIGEIGIAYNYAFGVSGATGAVTWTQPSGTLPAGLTLSSAGVLSGTPTGAGGISYATIRATDAGSGDTLDIDVSVTIAFALGYAVTPRLRWAMVSVPVVIDVSIPTGDFTGSYTGVGPYTYTPSVGNDAWLSISSSGIITGTPPASAISPLVLSVPTDSIHFQWTVTDALGATTLGGILGGVIPNDNANTSIQPQKNTVDVGRPGPAKLNLIEGSNVKITASNDGTTAGYKLDVVDLTVPSAYRQTVAMGSSGDRGTPIDISATRLLTMTSSANITINSGGYTDQAFALSSGQKLQLVNGSPTYSITLGVAFTPSGTVIGPGQSVELFGEPGPPSSVWRVLTTGGGSGGGGVASVVAGTNVTVDDTDPANPVVSATSGGVNNQTGTTYTFTLSDDGQTIVISNASAIALTIPTDASVALPIGAKIAYTQGGAGSVTVTGASGVTVHAPNGNVTGAAFDGGVAEKIAANEWQLWSGPALGSLAIVNDAPSDGTMYGRKNGAWAATGGGGGGITAMNEQTGTTYTLVLADATKAVRATNASAIALTVPTNASVPLPLLCTIPIIQGGAGKVTITAASGVTFELPFGAATTAVGDFRVLFQRAANVWVVA